MATTKKTTKKVSATQTLDKATVGMEVHQLARDLVSNAAVTRAELLSQIIDGGGKDLNKDCGYPDSIDATAYKNFYAREGIAARVVDVWPEESWSSSPTIYETEDPENETEFEKAWENIAKEFNAFSLLARADTLSGVGSFGLVLIGIDDGKELNDPIDGISADGKVQVGTKGEGDAKHKLLYLRPFQESVVKIATTENNVTSPRFGLPTMYNITFDDAQGSSIKKVHWHRVIHLADKREMSDVYGTPRMQKSYNRLLDLRKVLGGSGEMFWKGGFPGYSFEVNNDQEGVEFDKASLRTEMTNYMMGLQRYLALEGVSAKSLAPQVADPKNHLEAQLNAIAIAEGIPKRILFGSEQGELASSQDSKTWNRRLKKRQDGYVTPYVIRPFVDRLIAIGVLPFVEEYFVEWPDLATQTDNEKAEVAKSWAEALAKYVAGGVEEVVPIEEFLSLFGGLPVAQINQIVESLKGQIMEEDALGAEEDDEEETLSEDMNTPVDESD